MKYKEPWKDSLIWSFLKETSKRSTWIKKERKNPSLLKNHKSTCTKSTENTNVTILAILMKSKLFISDIFNLFKNDDSSSQLYAPQ
jgi:hypothetical protein